MVRGTNKIVIEINDTGNPYFERAVLYVKAHPKEPSKKKMEEEAQQYLATIQTVHCPRLAALKQKISWKLCLAALSGGTAAAFLLASVFN